MEFEKMTVEELKGQLEFAKDFINKAANPENYVNEVSLKSAWDAVNAINAELARRAA